MICLLGLLGKLNEEMYIKHLKLCPSLASVSGIIVVSSNINSNSSNTKKKGGESIFYHSVRFFGSLGFLEYI